MNSAYGYNPPAKIKNFGRLRTVTLWAGAFGLGQSIAWIALTITSILAYNCIIDVENLSFGNLVGISMYQLYFRGHCLPTGMQGYDFTLLESVDTIFDPTQLLIWVCVYLGVSVCWLLISALLLTHIRKDNVKATLGVLYTWVIITFAVVAMDTALGVIFGIDYGRFSDRAYNYNYSDLSGGAINPKAADLVAGAVVAISLMVISFKGFVLWIINFGLMIYLFKHAIRIATDKDNNDTLFMPRKDSDDILATRPPIDAFEEPKSNTGYVNEVFISETRSVDTIELNQDPLARAARMSTDPSLQERRFRNLDNFQQYPPPRYSNNNNYTNNNNNITNNNNPKSQQQQQQQQDTVVTSATIAVAAFPQPDYSPPMSRANQQQQGNGLLRNQRYQ